MKRLGKYSGKIYEEDEVYGMEECGIQITDEQAKDKEWLERKRLKNLKDCMGCFGCPMAQGGVV